MKRLKALFSPMTMPHWSQDLLLTIPRVACGFMLATDFGAAKFGMPWSPTDNNLGLFEVAFWFPNDVAEFGGIFALFPVFFAWMGAFSEAVGGLLWIVGLKTRITSFLIFCTMFVAVFFQQFGNGTWQMLPGLGFLWVSLFYIILGSGRFGLDFLITQHFFKAEKIAYLLLAMFAWTTIGCVQQTHKQTVEFVLDVSQIKDIKTVGIRGEGKPLSWQTDLMMNPIKKDSLYALKITAETGYQFVEVKFVVNGQFELENKPNRRVVFDQSGYTTYKAIFDIGQD